MKDSDKIHLANLILNFVSDHQEDKKSIPIQVGSLNKRLGNNGFKMAEVGTPVFDNGEKYFIMLESLDGKTNVMVTYYKETLKPAVDFI